MTRFNLVIIEAEDDEKINSETLSRTLFLLSFDRFLIFLNELEIEIETMKIEWTDEEEEDEEEADEEETRKIIETVNEEDALISSILINWFLV